MKVSQMVRDHLKLYNGEIPLATTEVINMLYDLYYKREQLIFALLHELGEVRISEFSQMVAVPDNENYSIETWKELHTGDFVVRLKRTEEPL